MRLQGMVRLSCRLPLFLAWCVLQARLAVTISLQPDVLHKEIPFEPLNYRPTVVSRFMDNQNFIRMRRLMENPVDRLELGEWNLPSRLVVAYL